MFKYFLMTFAIFFPFFNVLPNSFGEKILNFNELLMAIDRF